jgi:hypothetical protein
MISLIGLRLVGVGLFVSLGMLAQPDVDLRTFTSGGRNKFSSAGHPKAHRLNLQMSFPKTWAALEGERPHILQKFVSENGRGLEMAVLTVMPIPLPDNKKLSAADMKEALSDGGALIPPGARLLSTQHSEIEGLPTLLIDYSAVNDRVGLSIFQRAWCVNFFADNRFVSIVFGVAAQSEAANPENARIAAERRMVAYKPLFLMMANSIVLPERYR